MMCERGIFWFAYLSLGIQIMKTKPAIFLDRDGVLTEERGFLHNADEMVVYDYSGSCVEKLHRSGFLAIVITNQSGVARGYFTEDELEKMNIRLMEATRIDAVCYCPHHPDGKIERYRKVCDCRKPKTGLIDKACKEHEIDLSHSFFIGDRECDIRTGQNAGIKTILVRTGYGLDEEKRDLHPDFIVDDLRDAVEIITGDEEI